MTCTSSQEKKLSACQERATRYKLTALKTRAQVALAAAKRLGIDVESIILRNTSTKVRSQLSLTDDAVKLSPHICTASSVYR